jgi:hypothetical protein
VEAGSKLKAKGKYLSIEKSVGKGQLAVGKEIKLEVQS